MGLLVLLGLVGTGVPAYSEGIAETTRDITGFISLDKSILELLDFPGLDADGVSGPDEEGFLTTEVSVIGELLPKQKDSFRVAVSIYWPSEETVTKLRYDFLTPAGHTAVGERELTIPGPPPDQQ